MNIERIREFKADMQRMTTELTEFYSKWTPQLPEDIEAEIIDVLPTEEEGQAFARVAADFHTALLALTE